MHARVHPWAFRLEEQGVAHCNKILQMGAHVGGPRNLPKSLCRIHAIFGASEYRCQSSQVSSTVCTSSGPWIKSLSKSFLVFVLPCLDYPKAGIYGISSVVLCQMFTGKYNKLTFRRVPKLSATQAVARCLWEFQPIWHLKYNKVSSNKP